jgi:hypothetical protein
LGIDNYPGLNPIWRHNELLQLCHQGGVDPISGRRNDGLAGSVNDIS